MKIINVVGARPNFMKIAPLMEAYKKYPIIQAKLVHTGQHYDQKLSDLFFKELGIPEPDIYLGVGSGSHGEQTGKVMMGFEKVLFEHKPDVVVVVGDVNSTIACALCAVKLGIKVAHVEAGLRSYDRGMPEEVNRILTDQISDLLFTTERNAENNLVKEGIEKEKIHFVGNTMIDTLYKHKQTAEKSTILSELHLKSGEYITMTLHRPSNVDNIDNFKKIFEAVSDIQKDIKVVFPVHPRTRNRIDEFGLSSMLDELTNLQLIEPVGYLDFLKLLSESKLVITDSGGIQEETTVLRVPCLTLRNNTERPVTLTQGTNKLVGNDVALTIAESKRILSGDSPKGKTPELWDGKAAERIVEILHKLA